MFQGELHTAEPLAVRSWLTETFTSFRPTRLAQPVRLTQAIAPILSRFRHDLSHRLRELARPPLPTNLDGFLDDFERELEAQLDPLITSPLVLELNVARVQGRLRGERPADRLADYVMRFPEELAPAFFAEYAVLAETLRVRYANALEAAAEMFERLCQDWPRLQATFGLTSSTRVASVQPGLGDRHVGGRTVNAVLLSDGTQLAYKPRPCGSAQRYADAVAWVNGRLEGPKLAAISVVALPTHAWVKWVPHARCEDAAAVDRFFYREGAQLALLHALLATDMHPENVVASGEHPVFIDLETVLHPEGDLLQPQTEQDPAKVAFTRSVIAVGLLPQQLAVSEEEAPIAVGGALSMEGQRSARPFPTLVGEGDELAVRLETGFGSAAGNLPRLDGAELSPVEHLDAFLRGFRAAYRAILHDREAFIRGPLQAFADCELRVVLRSSFEYANLLIASYHPDYQRDPAAQARLFGRLTQATELNPGWAHVVPSEVAALRRGDLPIFTMRPTSRSLTRCDGQVVPDFLPEPALRTAERRVRSLSEEDLAKQEWMIRAAFSTTRAYQRTPATGRGVERARPSPALLVRHACVLGDEILQSAYGEGEGRSWLGLTSSGEKHQVIGPLPLDLYGGRVGIALFLAQLGATSGEQRFTSAAQELIRGSLALAEARPERFSGAGAFTGLGGLVYALTFLSRLWSDLALLQQAERWLQALQPSFAGGGFDLIGGCGGTLAVATVLDEAGSTSLSRDAMDRCIAHLSANAQSDGDGAYWKMEMGAMSGFAHGVGGTAWALARAALRRHDLAALQLAHRAMRFEHGLYDSARQNWLITVKEATGRTFDDDCVRWCWGAAGVALSRLPLLAVFDDAFLREDVERAAATTLHRGFGESHSLCHGDLGNYDILLQCSQALQDPRLLGLANAALAESLEREGAGGWQPGNVLSIPTAGLFTGSAGIGYGLLRAADPAHVPSLLSLQLPPERHG